MRTIFYSWQSDLPSATNRGFIEECLEKAIDEIHAQEKVRVLEADRDTQGETGSPDIAETIFDKIDRCSAFVADVSFINGARRTPPEDGSELPDCGCTRVTPNPNVMGEWGRATLAVGFERIICVLNTTTGTVEELPFDMRKRSVITYSLRKGEPKAEARKMLVGKLKAAIRDILALPMAMLDLQFADSESHAPCGTEMSSSVLVLEYDSGSIPSYHVARGGGVLGDLDSGIINSMRNPDYYLEMVVYLEHLYGMIPVSLILKNTGGRLLRNARFEGTVAAMDGLRIIEAHQMPDEPEQNSRMLAVRTKMPAMKPAHVAPGTVDVLSRGGEFKISVKFGDMQAKASMVSDVFYVGSAQEPRVEIIGSLFADELSEPIPASVVINFEISRREFTFDDLNRLLDSNDD